MFELSMFLLIYGVTFFLPIVSGFLVESATGERGRKPLLIVGAINAVVWGALFAFGMSWLGCTTGAVFFGTVGALIAASWEPVRVAMVRGDEASFMRQWAPAVEHWLLEQFQTIDANADGVIVRADLTALRDRSDENIRRLCTIALTNMSSLGHVIAEHTHMIPVTIMAGNTPITTFTQHVDREYGISRGDIVGCADRLRHRYRNW